LLDRIVDGAHRFASADEILKSAVLKELLPHRLPGGFFGSCAKEVDQSQSKFRDVDRATKMRVGASFEGLFFDRASARAAERDEDELTVKPAQFVQDRKAAVGSLIVAISSIDIEQNGLDMRFARPAGEVLVGLSKHDLKPGHQLWTQVFDELIVYGDNAHDGEA